MNLFELFVKIGADDQASDTINKVTNLSKTATNTFSGFANETQTLTNKIAAMSGGFDVTKEKLDDLTKKIDESVKATGADSKETQDLADKLSQAEKEAANAENALKRYNEGLKETEESSKKSNESLAKFLDTLTKASGTALKTAAEVGAATAKEIASGVAAITTSSIDNYASYEQLVGGIETLFGAGGKSLEEYAAYVGQTTEEASVKYEYLMQAQQTMLDNADKAYRTAGLSANEYMETVTSFAATLVSSLGGDTLAASEMADQALVDMADNANKMGTSMESIQNAYQGFAKQNYSMLDNLKLGYGGTQAEMFRLLQDATELNEEFANTANFSLDSSGHLEAEFSDIVEAIHIVQTEMGITGTTALEAGTTIEGSLSSTKAAWENLLTGMANNESDLGLLVDNLISTIVGDGTETNLGLIGNIIPAIEAALNSANALITDTVPKIIPIIADIISDNLPVLLDSGVQLVGAIANGILDTLPELLEIAQDILSTILDVFVDNLPEIKEYGIRLLSMLADGILTSIPLVIGALPDVMTAIFNFLADNLPKMVEYGAKFLGEFIGGILSAIPDLLLKLPKVIEALLSVFDAADAAMKDAGKYLLEGLWNGISDKVAWLKGKVSGVVDKIKSWFTGKEGFDEHSPSKWAEEVGKYVSEGLANGIEEEATEAQKAAEKMAQNIYSGLSDWATQQTKFLKLSLEDQLDMWREIQNQFEKESQQYIKAQEKIVDLEESIYAEKEKNQKEYYESLFDQIEKDTKFKELNLYEQYKSWKEAQEKIISDSEQYAEAEEKIFDLRKEIQEEYFSSVKELTEKNTKLFDEYQNTLESRSNQIYNSFGLFDEVAEAEEVSGEKLLDNLEDQITTMRKFYSGVEELTMRGVGEKLVEELREMGPSALDELNALLDLSEEKLSEYAALYEEKQNYANYVAQKELTKYRVETIDQISENIDEIEDLYEKNAPYLGETLTDGLAQGITNGISTVVDAAKKMANSVVNEIQSTFNSVVELEELQFGYSNLSSSTYQAKNSHVGTSNDSNPVNIVVQSVLDGNVIGETAYKYSQNKKRVYGVWG